MTKHTIQIKYIDGVKQYSPVEDKIVDVHLVGFLYEIGATFSSEDGTYIVVSV